MRLAVVLFRGIVCSDRTSVWIGVKEEERLEVIFDTFADHIFPPGADLQQKTEGREQLVGAHVRYVQI